jgi:altronate hydrolase
VVKYGQFIGHASADIAPGAHVHTHNLAFAATAADYEFSTNVKPWCRWAMTRGHV